MKKILFPILLLAGHIVLTSSGGKPKPPIWEQENVSFPMMNQEIRHSMQEHERQVEMKNKQHINLVGEGINKKQWSKFKETTKKIQDRLRIVDFALQAIPTAYRKFHNFGNTIKKKWEKRFHLLLGIFSRGRLVIKILWIGWKKCLVKSSKNPTLNLFLIKGQPPALTRKWTI